MNLDDLVDIFKNGNLSEIDTFEAALAVESAIEELRDINAALYEARTAVAELIEAADAVPRCSYCEHDAEWDRLATALSNIGPQS